MLIVTNCKEMGVKRAKELGATNPSLMLYETPTRKYIITDQEQTQEYRSIDFRHLSLKALGKEEEEFQ